MSKLIVPFVAILCLSFMTKIYGQDLHIFYDAQTENLRYEYKGKTIHRPKVSRGSNIFLHVQNFNNYLYSVEIKANETDINVPSGGGGNQLSGLLSMGGDDSPMQLLSSGGGGNLMKHMLQLGEEPSRIVKEETGLKSLGSVSDERAEFNRIEVEYRQTVEALIQLEAEIDAIRVEVNNEIQANQINGIVMQEITKLKVNPDLKPEQIKKLSSEYLNKVFNVQNVGEVDLGYVLQRNDMKAVLAGNLAQLNRKGIDYQALVKRIKNVAEFVDLLGSGGNEFMQVKESIMETYAHTQKVQQTLQDDIVNLTSAIPKIKQNDTQSLVALRYEYEAISSNNFTKTYRTPVSGDLTTFNVMFKLKDTTSNTQAQNLIEIAPIQVSAFGGFKVNASVGISFGQFQDRLQEYYIRDSIISSEEQDAFFPVLTSFVHFYSQSTKNISLGGSIGVGFPVASVGGNQSVAFFAGPSLIVGKSDRLVISGGIMGGKVKRLGQGYQTGDLFRADASLIPLKERYELGYFIGMSYNLSK